jgi:hypothetical protein
VLKLLELLLDGVPRLHGLRPLLNDNIQLLLLVLGLLLSGLQLGAELGNLVLEALGLRLEPQSLTLQFFVIARLAVSIHAAKRG